MKTIAPLKKHARNMSFKRTFSFYFIFQELMISSLKQQSLQLYEMQFQLALLETKKC